MPTSRFLSSIIHEAISVRPQGIARRSNGYYWNWMSNRYYWVCNWGYKLVWYGIICLYMYHATPYWHWHPTLKANPLYWYASTCTFSFSFCCPINFILLKRRLSSVHLYYFQGSIYKCTIMTLLRRRMRFKMTENSLRFATRRFHTLPASKNSVSFTIVCTQYPSLHTCWNPRLGGV